MIALLLMKQIAVLFLTMMCGFILVKSKLLKADSSKTLSVICIYILMPCVVINSFQIEYSSSIRNGFLLAVLAAIIIHIVLLFLTWVLGRFLKLNVVEKTSLIYSNAGNLVIPLVMAVLGNEWVIYANAFLCVQLLILWTHGQSLMEQKVQFNWKKIIHNVNLIAVLIGIILFFTQIKMPEIVGTTMSNLSATLGPVSMMMLGMTMAQIEWKKVFLDTRIYIITILKMIVCPAVILLILKFSPLSTLVPNGQTILLISLIAVITPSATTVVQLAQLYDQEPSYASSINVLTTIVCIVTMPLMVMLYLK
ncbi:AEC family transporter [Clostridium sp. Marseille-P299]|uniref:AEC family transporter n=1 Tax=Clostridium sp. Marseille-P299 TaxID=1805477 RepID=UPI00082DA77C|nr:AEC family transporter [Clostridium sp. Marseille-P299]